MNNLNIVFYFITYNRPKILKESIYSAINNTSIQPNEVWIIDDGSVPDMQLGLLDFSLKYSNKFPINLILHAKNYGIGYSFEKVYNLINQNNDLDIACILESDYVWRKDWLKDCVEVFEASKSTLAIAGTDHPDMYDRKKTHETFPKIMEECFGQDLKSRSHLYNPFDLNVKSGKIKVQGVSNSCGCTILNWKRIKQVTKNLEESKKIKYNDFWQKMDIAFEKSIPYGTKRYASDAWMSGTISKYGEMDIELKNLDLSKNFPFLSICDYSISQHICGGGVNGSIVPEGATFVNSPKWNDEYLNKNPRINE